MSYGALAFAAAVRVVVGVHNRTADGGTDSQMTGLARFAHADYFVFEIAYLTYGRFALQGNESHFAGGHFQGRVSAFLCHNLRRNARGSRYLRASAGFKLDCVNDGTYGDIGKRKAVARFDIRARTRNDLIAHRKTYGCEYISLFAVRIRKKGYVRRTVGVVLYGLYRCGYAVFIAFEIYNSVFGSVSAAYVTNGYFTLIVSAARLALIVQ